MQRYAGTLLVSFRRRDEVRFMQVRDPNSKRQSQLNQSSDWTCTIWTLFWLLNAMWYTRLKLTLSGLWPGLHCWVRPRQLTSVLLSPTSRNGVRCHTTVHSPILQLSRSHTPVSCGFCHVSISVVRFYSHHSNGSLWWPSRPL